MGGRERAPTERVACAEPSNVPIRQGGHNSGRLAILTLGCRGRYRGRRGRQKDRKPTGALAESPRIVSLLPILLHRRRPELSAARAPRRSTRAPRRSERAPRGEIARATRRERRWGLGHAIAAAITSEGGANSRANLLEHARLHRLHAFEIRGIEGRDCDRSHLGKMDGHGRVRWRGRVQGFWQRSWGA